MNEMRQPTSSTIEALNVLVADLTVFNQKLRHFHWNVLGENFFDLHDFFGQIYGEIVEHIDQFAERIRALQETPIHTLSMMLSIANVKETQPIPKDMAMCEEILKDFQTIITDMETVVAEASKTTDRPTVFLVDTIVGCYEKHQWFLRSFLGRK